MTEGIHHVNGRAWRTTCSAYITTIERCRTDRQSGATWNFVTHTYNAAPRIAWLGNRLGQRGQWISAGRAWKTDCDTAATGYNGCRTDIKSGNTWVLNNRVRFSNDYYVTSSGNRDRTFDLPGPLGAIVAVKYDGGSTKLKVEGLNSAGTPVSVIAMGTGTYQGVTALNLFEERPNTQVTKIRATATGPWIVTVKPSSTAPKFSGVVSGATDSVLWYTGAAQRMRVEADAPSGLVAVLLYDSGDQDLLAQQTGRIDKTTALCPGQPCSSSEPQSRGRSQLSTEVPVHFWRAGGGPCDVAALAAA